MLLARILVCFVLFCLPVIAFMILSGKAENALLLIFPVVAAVPAVLGALLVFAPIEWALDAQGLRSWKNVAVPLAGASLIFVVLAIAGSATGKLDLFVRNTLADPVGAGAALGVWVVLGAVWGGLWRLTAWMAEAMGWATP